MHGMLSLLGMVLFYCTVVAMKAQDPVGAVPGLDDYLAPHESLEYSA